MDKKLSWVEELDNRFHGLMGKFDMPEDIAFEIHNFVLEVAREQYKTGNRSGIAWLRRKQSEERRTAPLTAMATA